MCRTILVDCTDGASIAARLRVARSLAVRFEAALTGLHASPPSLAPSAWQDSWSVDVSSELVEAQRKANQEALECARSMFDRVCGGEVPVTWCAVEDYPGWPLAEAARASDLVVATRGAALNAVEQVVTAAAVPVLALPADTPDHDFGRAVLIGWNGSREATRAAHDALPFLRAAARVILCVVGEESSMGLEQAAPMLRRHGVPVEAERGAWDRRKRRRVPHGARQQAPRGPARHGCLRALAGARVRPWWGHPSCAAPRDPAGALQQLSMLR